MRILVTGATGFIGNYVIHNLAERGAEVIATSRNTEKAKSAGWFKKVKYLPFDINEPANDDKNLFEYFGRPDKVIHLGWENLPNYRELFHLEKNLFSNYFFLKRLVEGGLKDLTVTGTCLEYGMQNDCLSETMITDPQNPYAIAKDCLRKFLDQLRQVNGFSFKWVRLFYIYGAGQNEKSLFSQLEQAVRKGDKEFKMSAGDQLRDFLPVGEVADILSGIALQNSVTGIINCCSGRPVSVKKFVEDYFTGKGLEVKLILGHYPYPDYEPFAFWGDRNKLNSILKDEKGPLFSRE